MRPLLVAAVVAVAAVYVQACLLFYSFYLCIRQMDLVVYFDSVRVVIRRVHGLLFFLSFRSVYAYILKRKFHRRHRHSLWLGLFVVFVFAVCGVREIV